MRFLFPLACAVACGSISVLGCDPYNTTFVNKKAKMYQLEDKNSKIKRTFYGNVKVLDGCRFQISNLTIIPPAQALYFYAVPLVKPSEDEPELYARIVTMALGSYNGQTAVFHLQQDYSWDDFGVVTLYSEQDRRHYAAFGVNSKVKDSFQLPEAKDADLSLEELLENSGIRASLSVAFFAWLLVVNLFLG